MSGLLSQAVDELRQLFPVIENALAWIKRYKLPAAKFTAQRPENVLKWGPEASVASHKKFEEKHGLPFTLLSDTGLEVIRAYDVLKPGKDGKPANSLIRSNCLIDENGVIVRAFGGEDDLQTSCQLKYGHAALC